MKSKIRVLIEKGGNNSTMDEDALVSGIVYCRENNLGQPVLWGKAVIQELILENGKDIWQDVEVVFSER